ncbi:MAG: hypothetical protein J5981_05835 [Lachnospira sp.]|nr:hypothetical protein [Lachnospira sp.]
MGLFNYIKNTIKENYDIEDIDDFVYDDWDEFETDGEAEGESKEEEPDISGLLEEFEKNYEKHGKKAQESKTDSQKQAKKAVKNKTLERRRKAQEEEAKYDQLLSSVQAKSLINVVDKINRQENSQKLSGRIAAEEKQEERYIEELKKEAERQSLLEAVGNVDIDKSRVQEDIQEESYQENAVDIPDVSRKPKKLEEVNTDLYDKEAAKEYVRNQCEIMEEAAGHIELAMEEYNIVTEHFSDIQLIETAPDNIRKKIIETAERVDNLTVDRRIFKSGEHKLSNNTYHRMEQFEEELPRGIKYLEKQESYYETVKHDMRLLEGERAGLCMEANALTTRQLRIRSLAMTAIAGLTFVFIVFFVALSVMEDSQNIMLYTVVVILGAILAMGMFALLKHTERQVLVTEIKLNKVTSILNKTKIKYINAANTLDYEYNKYRVKSSYELAKKYEVYLDMKNEQRKLVKMTTNLNEAEEDLVKNLRKLGLYDARLWLGQVKALVNGREMVEVRHDLNIQRQKLRKQIEYNEGRIEEAKKNIMHMAADNPECMKEALEIIEQFENRNRRKNKAV